MCEKLSSLLLYDLLLEANLFCVDSDININHNYGDQLDDAN